MSDKTRLEFEIEHHERLRTPLRVKTLIVLLVISLCIIGVYTSKIKQRLLETKREAVVMENNSRKEKVALLRQIKQLQAKQMSSEPDIN
ncbi:MAG TPA: hypothetical protein ENH01_02485 [Nitrospirae bacterium]|nr:hypothetical protein [Nitrospirota bacterium]